MQNACGPLPSWLDANVVCLSLKQFTQLCTIVIGCISNQQHISCAVVNDPAMAAYFAGLRGSCQVIARSCQAWKRHLQVGLHFGYPPVIHFNTHRIHGAAKYMGTFAIHIPQMLVCIYIYMPYMDPMGYIFQYKPSMKYHKMGYPY